MDTLTVALLVAGWVLPIFAVLEGVRERQTPRRTVISVIQQSSLGVTFTSLLFPPRSAGAAVFVVAGCLLMVWSIWDQVRRRRRKMKATAQAAAVERR
jgi:hypothetical protein